MLDYQHEQQRAYSALANLASSSPYSPNTNDTAIEQIDHIELVLDNMFLELQKVREELHLLRQRFSNK